MMTSDAEHATERIWSKGTYRLREIMENPGNHVMYYLTDGPERVFVSEELMLIPDSVFFSSVRSYGCKWGLAPDPRFYI